MATEVYGGYDIIVVVTTHGLSVNTSMEDYEKRQLLLDSEPYHLDIMEASSCGLRSFTNEEANITFLTTMFAEDGKYSYKNDPNFLHTLQTDLRDISKPITELTPERLGDKYIHYARSIEREGFNVISNQNGYIERIYIGDDDINVIQVLHASHGPFEQNQQLLDLLAKYRSHPLVGETVDYTTRSDLFKLLMDKGYKHPLVIDLSCGTFLSELGDMTEKQSRALTEDAIKQKHAGSIRKSKRRKSKRRKSKKITN